MFCRSCIFHITFPLQRLSLSKASAKESTYMRNVTYVSPLFDSFNFIAHILCLTFSGVRWIQEKLKNYFLPTLYFFKGNRQREVSVSFIASDKRQIYLIRRRFHLTRKEKLNFPFSERKLRRPKRRKDLCTFSVEVLPMSHL